MTGPRPAERPPTPPLTPAPEQLIARIRAHPRRLILPALILIAAAGATGYFATNLAEPLEDWMLFAAACLVVLLFVTIPLLRWATRRVTITTRRLIITSGVFSRERREFSHARGYSVRVRRGVLQRFWGTGTVMISDGISDEVALRDLAQSGLVHETLADQIEESQIQQHRDSQGFSFGHDAPRPSA